MVQAPEVPGINQLLAFCYGGCAISPRNARSKHHQRTNEKKNHPLKERVSRHLSGNLSKSVLFIWLYRGLVCVHTGEPWQPLWGVSSAARRKDIYGVQEQPGDGRHRGPGYISYKLDAELVKIRGNGVIEFPLEYRLHLSCPSVLQNFTYSKCCGA